MASSNNEPRSLKEQRIVNKMLAAQAKILAQRHLTRLGLNGKNVQSSLTETVRPTMASPIQRREDYVTVPEWETRQSAEQLPSIQRNEQRERDNKIASIGRVAVVKRMYAIRPETITRVNAELAQNTARLGLIRKLETHIHPADGRGFRETGTELRREWFPGSF